MTDETPMRYFIRSFTTDEATRRNMRIITEAAGTSQSAAIRQAIADAAARVQRRQAA